MRNNIIIGAFSLMVIAFTVNSCVNHKSKSESKTTIISEQNATIEGIELDNNLIAHEKERVEADLNTITESYSFLEDSLKAMGVKAKNLKAALFIAQSTKGHGEGTTNTVTITKNDTTYIASEISITEPYFLFSSTTLPDNSYTYEYDVYDSLSLLNIRSRKNFFHKWENKVRVVNSNPKTTISGITSLTIKEKPKRITIGLMVGYGVTNSGLSPFAGVGISTPIISF